MRLGDFRCLDSVDLTVGTDRLRQRADRGRKRYLRKHYGKDVNNPLLYHLVINTDLVDYDSAAALIGNVILQDECERRS